MGRLGLLMVDGAHFECYYMLSEDASDLRSSTSELRAVLTP